MSESETIAALATAPGTGGVCIIRVSGPHSETVARAITGKTLQPRYATFCHFKGTQGRYIDTGLALYFPAPRSFTGEDVLELHGHGGAMVSDMVLQAALQAGARMARPGEFSERAFLNGKLDLAQAEAVADLINAGSRQAAQAALRTLDGDFSRHVNTLLRELTELRVYIESSLDFADEDIQFIQADDIKKRLQRLSDSIMQLSRAAQRGRLLNEGRHIAIAGKPNAGKSSLMNALCGSDSAIVTATPGTTRDVLRERIQIAGVVIHLHDTAGLRARAEPIEQEGIRRAKDVIAKADMVLWVHDDTVDIDAKDYRALNANTLVLVKNKIDISGNAAGLTQEDGHRCVRISATLGDGLDELRALIADDGMGEERIENEFSVRRRHLQALQLTQQFLDDAKARLEQSMADDTNELLAEELRLAHQALAEITGAFTPDDLLGKIFSEFCIGK